MATMYDVGTAPVRQTIWKTPQLGAEQVAVFKYDFDTMGGAQGDYIIGTLPANSVVTQVAYIATTAMVGSSDAETLGVSSGAGEFVTDLSGTSADTFTEGVPKIDDPSTWVSCASDTDLYFTIATADATAGCVYFIFRYFTVPTA